MTEKSKMSNVGLLALGACVGIGLAVAGYFASQTLYNSKVALNTAEVKGLAERRVQADRANWTIDYQLVTETQAGIADLYKQAEAHQQRIVAVLKENGFTDAEITPNVVDYGYEEFRDDNQNLVDQKHLLSGSVSVETDKVQQVRGARVKVNKLIADGIQINNRKPQYHFTKLNAIKPEMLSEATQNARAAANEFANNAGVDVGGIRDARQGNFFVRDVGADYGDTRKIEKDVRVVTTITFYLTE